jgi:hypothetical protein
MSPSDDQTAVPRMSQAPWVGLGTGQARAERTLLQASQDRESSLAQLASSRREHMLRPFPASTDLVLLQEVGE